MIPDSENHFENLSNEAHETFKACLTSFYEKQSNKYITPFVLLAMLTTIHSFYELTASSLIDTAPFKEEAIETVNENIDKLKENIFNNPNDKKDESPFQDEFQKKLFRSNVLKLSQSEIHHQLGSKIHEELKKVFVPIIEKYKKQYNDLVVCTSILGSLQIYFELYAEHFIECAPNKEKAREHVYKNLMRLAITVLKPNNKEL